MNPYKIIKKAHELYSDPHTGEILFRNRWYPRYYIDKIIEQIDLMEMDQEEMAKGKREEEAAE
jgi:hypothetical protein